LLGAFVASVQILPQALFVHLSDVDLVHLILLTVVESLAEHLVLESSLLVALKLLLVEHLLTHVLSA
jgi:hypothetical protein